MSPATSTGANPGQVGNSPVILSVAHAADQPAPSPGATPAQAGNGRVFLSVPPAGDQPPPSTIARPTPRTPTTRCTALSPPFRLARPGGDYGRRRRVREAR